MDENKIKVENEITAAPKLVRSSRYPRPSKPTDQFLWLGLLFFFVLGLGSGWLIWGNTPAADAEEATRRDVPVGDDPSIGPADAPITVIEFSDYQCVFCQRWYNDVYSRLLDDYKGKIRFVYKDYPLESIHPDAQGAAEAANCAGEQNIYWQYHNALFDGKYGLGLQAYQQYASDLGLDMTAFNTCVSERRYKSEVEDDVNLAINVGVHSTPAFFVNGLLIVGAQPYEVFKQVIDQELAGQNPK
jgi:protein-disulfide isomerase